MRPPAADVRAPNVPPVSSASVIVDIVLVHDHGVKSTSRQRLQFNHSFLAVVIANVISISRRPAATRPHRARPSPSTCPLNTSWCRIWCRTVVADTAVVIVVDGDESNASTPARAAGPRPCDKPSSMAL